MLSALFRLREVIRLPLLLTRDNILHSTMGHRIQCKALSMRFKVQMFVLELRNDNGYMIDAIPFRDTATYQMFIQLWLPATRVSIIT